MKKILSIAVFLTAFALQAASIDWAIATGSSAIKNSIGDTMTGSAYLILTTDLSNIENSISENVSTFLDALDTWSFEQTSISAGKIDDGGTSTSSRLSTTIANSFAFLIYDSVKMEYYVCDPIKKVAYDELAETPVKQSVDFDKGTIGATKSSSASNPYLANFKSAVSVPEPATGALALAGLALLFRRKRA